MYTHRHTHRDTETCTDTHRDMHRHTCTHTDTHTDTQRHTDTQIKHMHTHTQRHRHIHTHTHRHTQTQIHTQTHTKTHRDTHTYTHTHTHTHCTHPQMLAAASTLRLTHLETQPLMPLKPSMRGGGRAPTHCSVFPGECRSRRSLHSQCLAWSPCWCRSSSWEAGLKRCVCVSACAHVFVCAYLCVHVCPRDTSGSLEEPVGF